MTNPLQHQAIRYGIYIVTSIVPLFNTESLSSIKSFRTLNASSAWNGFLDQLLSSYPITVAVLEDIQKHRGVSLTTYKKLAYLHFFLHTISLPETLIAILSTLICGEQVSKK